MPTVISSEEFFVPFQGRNPVLFFELQRSLNEYLPFGQEINIFGPMLRSN